MEIVEQKLVIHDRKLNVSISEPCFIKKDKQYRNKNAVDIVPDINCISKVETLVSHLEEVEGFPVCPKFVEIFECQSDESFYMFFKSIQADYDFYSHCLSILQAGLSKCFKDSIIIPRGSFALRAGLKSTMDLDVDILLPRSYITPEQLGPDNFPILVNTLSKILPRQLGCIHNVSTNNTRGFSFDMVIENVSIPVDLFPKLIGQNGRVYSVSPTRQKESRNWITCSILSQECKQNKFDDEQLCAILLLKLWKQDMKKEYPLPMSILKGYHIVLAMEKILISAPNSSNIFSRAKSIEYLKCIIQCLARSYEYYPKITEDQKSPLFDTRCEYIDYGFDNCEVKLENDTIQKLILLLNKLLDDINQIFKI